MSEYTISTTNISKRFGAVLAVDNVNLRVRKGEIYGFLGLNGAGKSTTIRLLLGMAHPTTGYAELFGEQVRTDAAFFGRVGHLVESPTAYPELTVRENLEVARRLQGLSDRTAIDRAIDLLGLGQYEKRRARALSSGNFQRLALARALLHDPELLILDEPANALDPAGVVEIRELLRHLALDKGVTVFMSSHILAEVDRLATRIGIVHEGRLIEEMDNSELERRRQRRLEVGAPDLAQAHSVLTSAGFSPTRKEHGNDHALLELRESRAVDNPEEVARLLAGAGVFPNHLAVVQEDLEEHFLRLTREKSA